MKYIYMLLIYLCANLALQAQTKLVFTYDAAGNQIERKFETTTSAKQFKEETINEKEVVAETLKEDVLEQLSNSIKVYPNPTKGNLRLEWEAGFENSIKEITVSDSGAIQTFQVPLEQGQNYVDIDLTNYALGLYLIHFVLDDSKIIVKKIIRN